MKLSDKDLEVFSRNIGKIPMLNMTKENAEILKSLSDEVIASRQTILLYENIIHAIANIDTIFYTPDGEEREFNETESLNRIEELVMPVWNEYCEKSRKETEKMMKDWV
jgi:hypothetical protein